MADTPIKYTGNDSDGKPQLFEFSTSEENYLAYQAGLRLSTADSDEVGSLALASAGNATVGSYSDTKFNQAVGTHGTTLTTATTTTTLYQTEGTADTSGSSYRKPIHHEKDGSKTELHEMTSSEIDSLTDRLIGTIFSNDYVGTYKLGSTSPGGGYSVEKSTIFSDTRTDGTTVNYNLYKRTSMTAPTAVKPLHIKRSSGRTGTYQGLQQMTAAQMQYTFGQTAKNRIMNGSNGVGTYLLLSSTEGDPTANGYGGTWVSKGTATDTKQETVATAYTRTSTRNFEGNYTRIRQSTFSRNFEGNYSRSFEGNYSRSFDGNYLGDYIVTRTEDYSRNFAGTYTGVSNFTRISTRTSSRNFLGWVQDSYLGNFTQNFSRNFTRIRSSSYTGNYAGDYSRFYARNFTGNFTGNYTGQTPTFTRTYAGNYVGATGPTFTGPQDQYVSGEYYWRYSLTQDEITVQWDGERVVDEQPAPIDTTTITDDENPDITYTRGALVLTSNTNYIYRVSRTRAATADYVGNYPGFTGNFIGNYVGGASSPYSGEQYSQSSGNEYYYSVLDYGGYSYNAYVYWAGSQKGPAQTASGTGPNHSVPVVSDGVYDYARGAYQTVVYGNKGDPTTYWYYAIKRRSNSTNYLRASTAVRTSTYSRLAAWTRISTRTSSRNYARNYTRNFTRISTRNITDAYSRNYEGNFTQTFTRNRESNFSRNYAGDFTGDYIGAKDYEGNYARNFSRSFTRNFTRLSTRVRSSAYTRDRSSNYNRTRVSNYQGDVTDTYTRNRSSNYIGNYISDEIQNTNETIETFTLYVRTA